jgi:hypothetical protein
MAKAKSDLTNKSVAQKLDKGNLVETNLTGNPNVTIPAPIMLEFTDSKTNLNTKEANVISKTQALTLAVSEKDEAETRYDKGFTAIVNSVNSQTSDETKILSTGLDVADEASAPQPLLKPANFHVSEGDNSGENDLTWNPVKGATGNVIQKAIIPIDPTPPNPPQPPIGSQWITVKVLGRVTKWTAVTEPGEFAWWRVYAVRGDEQSPATDPIAQISPY